jgi:hypothetical protein
MEYINSLQGEYDSIKAFSEIDFTADLKKMSFPILVLRGDFQANVCNGIARSVTNVAILNWRLTKKRAMLHCQRPIGHRVQKRWRL